MQFIAHLDMDAFYASVELLRYPQLRGKPVVIGGRRRGGESTGGELRTLRDYTGRGVITTSTYEARALGVFSGMGLMKSAKLAPDAVLLPADFDEYRHYSKMFKEAVRTVAPEIEDRGIDEIYIDLTALVMTEAPGMALDPWQRARDVAALTPPSPERHTGAWPGTSRTHAIHLSPARRTPPPSLAERSTHLAGRPTVRQKSRLRGAGPAWPPRFFISPPPPFPPPPLGLESRPPPRP